ncbi:MAG: CUAEP/CCAEP-tail radical SAM (seleno)protein, partial [Burkholderiales bacterium]
MARRVILISPYDLGRQPFALAHPAALLERAGFGVSCLDLSLQKLDSIEWRDATLIAIYLGMHTATRIALEALPRIRALAPAARLCAYGLYAPMNAALLRARGVTDVIGGEFETALLAAARRAGDGTDSALPGLAVIHRGKVDFAVPQRAHLPPLARYARLMLPDGSEKTVGFAEASRGCKHWCRHCPVVPVYQGRFRAVPAAIVLADIRQQVAQGAQHISFGDPDFLNGPTHALRIVRALHAEFPALTW